MRGPEKMRMLKKMQRLSNTQRMEIRVENRILKPRLSLHRTSSVIVFPKK